ncbi:MAG: hypothetical protein JWM98_2837, partial [Thermoleophilia bacterium]|nr:hypothetical protein [Thermoleophilia bacterium]
MSDVLGPRRRRGRTDAPHHAHDADPWWGVETVPAHDSLGSSSAAAPREGRDARAR